VEERQAAGGLERTVAAAARAHASAAWIAYSVPAIPGDHNRCEPDRPRRMYLEGRPARNADPDPAGASAGPPPDLVVLFRVDAGKVQKLRVAAVDCELDAGGLPLVWLTGATSADSIAMLRGIVSAPSVAGLDVEALRPESALMAMALHADPAAQRALEETAAPGHATSLRKRAVFWLGAGRGAVDVLIRLAREDETLDVRKEAMFWLSRSRDPRAQAFTDEILRR
jgi:hypothetical protein